MILRAVSNTGRRIHFRRRDTDSLRLLDSRSVSQRACDGYLTSVSSPAGERFEFHRRVLGDADAREQGAQARVVAERIKSRIPLQVKKEAGALFDRLIEPLEGLVRIAEAGPDGGDVIKGNVHLPRACDEVGENLFSFGGSSGLCESVAQGGVGDHHATGQSDSAFVLCDGLLILTFQFVGPSENEVCPVGPLPIPLVVKKAKCPVTASFGERIVDGERLGTGFAGFREGFVRRHGPEEAQVIVTACDAAQDSGVVGSEFDGFAVVLHAAGQIELVEVVNALEVGLVGAGSATAWRPR